MNEPLEFLDRWEAVCKDLSSYDDILSAQEFLQLKARMRSLKEALDQEEEAHRVLRIGVIGSVKAGKSTFLNSLLFQGENILPRAATPMTASLTRLCYAEKPFARFVFYTQEDWETINFEADRAEERIEKELLRQEEILIKKQEKSSHAIVTQRPSREQVLRNLPQESQACLELTQAARSSGFDIEKYLGKEETVDIIDINNIREKLEQYIGSKGELTPVVKYVVLGINNDNLRDIEVIDTPGLNDPVRSRSQETYKFMDQCDAVFILSRASQFLTEEDIILSKRTLAGCGIRHQVLVATQMDLSAQNEVGKIQSYKEAFQRSMQRVRKSSSLHDLHLEPVCISAFMYACAYKMKNNLSLDDEERKLQENIAQFSRDTPDTEEEFRRFSNMIAIYKQLKSWRQEKDQIILEHQRNRMNEAHREVLTILNSLRTGVDKDKRLLRENDINTLQKKHGQIREAMDSVSAQISDLFLEMENNVKNELAALRQRVLANSQQFDEIHVEKHTEQKNHSHTTGFIWKKTIYTTETITKFSADLSEALKQIKDFVSHIEKDINDTFKALLNKDSITNSIKKTILPVFRVLDISFDENIVILPVREVVHSINAPEFKFDNTPYNGALVGEFSDGILNDRVSAFKVAFQQQMQKLCMDIRNKLDLQREEISSLLFRQSSGFSLKLISSLDEQMAKIQDQMTNREESLRRYDEAKALLLQSYDKMAR